jgi:DNA-binding NtrC family response regulator
VVRIYRKSKRRGRRALGIVVASWPGMYTKHRLLGLSRILVLDKDGAVANTIADVLSAGVFEIVACQDLALARLATDLAQFRLVFFSPGDADSKALAVVESVLEHSPFASLILVVSDVDARLTAAAKRRGVSAVLKRSMLHEELGPLCARLGTDFAPRGPAPNRATQEMTGFALAVI